MCRLEGETERARVCTCTGSLLKSSAAEIIFNFEENYSRDSRETECAAPAGDRAFAVIQRGYNSPATTTSTSTSSYISADVFFPLRRPPFLFLLLYSFVYFFSFFFFSSCVRRAASFPLLRSSPGNFRVWNKRESRATNEFATAFESRPSATSNSN